MWAFSNSSIVQIPEPNNTLLFLLVLWPHSHHWKLGIMLLLLSSPMMENTVSTFYSRLIFHKGMGAWIGLQTYHASQGDRHLQGIMCVCQKDNNLWHSPPHAFKGKCQSSTCCPLTDKQQLTVVQYKSVSSSQFLSLHFDKFMGVPSLLTIFTVSLHQQCMPLSQYKVVCIPNTIDMLPAQKWNCDARNEFLLRKTYDPNRILLGDFFYILATLSQPEGIPWSTSSLIHRSSVFFRGYLLPGFTNSTAFMVMAMAYVCIDGAFSLKIGNSRPLIIAWYHLVAECCISFHDLMRILEPRFFRQPCIKTGLPWVWVADISNKYTAFDVCWHNYTITSYLFRNSPSKVILHVHHTIIWQTCQGWGMWQ